MLNNVLFKESGQKNIGGNEKTIQLVKTSVINLTDDFQMCHNKAKLSHFDRYEDFNLYLSELYFGLKCAHTDGIQTQFLDCGKDDIFSAMAESVGKRA